MLDAVKLNGLAIKCIPKNLENDYEINLEALKNTPYSIKYVN